MKKLVKVCCCKWDDSSHYWCCWDLGDIKLKCHMTCPNKKKVGENKGTTFSLEKKERGGGGVGVGGFWSDVTTFY